MESNNLLLSTKRGRIILAIGAVFIIAIIALIVVFVLGYKKDDGSITPPEEEHFIEEVDEVSGETIRTNKGDREGAYDDMIVMIGFYQLKTMGLSADQYSAVVNTVVKYISKNRPEIKQISYKKDSYKYLSKNFDKSFFIFVTNAGESFDVTLDTKNSIKDIDITIEKSK